MTIELPPRITPPPGCCTPPFGAPHTLLLPGEAGSVRHARAFTRGYVREHAPDAAEDHVDAVVLVVSELVTNPYRYGTEPGDSLRLVLAVEADRTVIECHDPVRRPRPRPDSPHRSRGRGLELLDALCLRWGVRDRPLGKAVWAVVSR